MKTKLKNTKDIEWIVVNNNEEKTIHLLENIGELLSIITMLFSVTSFILIEEIFYILLFILLTTPFIIFTIANISNINQNIRNIIREAEKTYYLGSSIIMPIVLFTIMVVTYRRLLEICMSG